MGLLQLLDTPEGRIKFMAAVGIVFIIAFVGMILYIFSNRNEYMVSFRDFPGQVPATAEMLARATSGYNRPSQSWAPDPYMNAARELSSIENSWTTANWKYTG